MASKLSKSPGYIKIVDLKNRTLKIFYQNSYNFEHFKISEMFDFTILFLRSDFCRSKIFKNLIKILGTPCFTTLLCITKTRIQWKLASRLSQIVFSQISVICFKTHFRWCMIVININWFEDVIEMNFHFYMIPFRKT